MMRADHLTRRVKQSSTLCLSEFACKALAGDRWKSSEQLTPRLEQAVRLYLSDKGAAELGWAYPDFLSTAETGAVEVELIVEGELLRALEAEAERQGVSVSQIAEHAAFYYAAELDAGRITQRIVNALEDDESA